MIEHEEPQNKKQRHMNFLLNELISAYKYFWHENSINDLEGKE